MHSLINIMNLTESNLNNAKHFSYTCSADEDKYRSES